MPRKKLSFKGARRFKIAGGNFGSTSGNVVNVNAQGSDVPWDDLLLGNQRQRRGGGGSWARRRSTSSIPPPSSASNRSSDLSEPDEAGGPSGQYSTRTSTEGYQLNLPSHSAPLPSYPANQLPPPAVPLHPDGFPPPPSNSLGLTDLQISTPQVYGSSLDPDLSQIIYPLMEPPIAVTTVITSTPHVDPQLVEESPATHFARLQAQQPTPMSTTQGYAHTIITYSPSPPLSPQGTPTEARATRRLSRKPTQVQAVLPISQTRHPHHLPPTSQLPSTSVMTAPPANPTLPPEPWASTARRICGTNITGVAVESHWLFGGHTSTQGTSINTIPYSHDPGPPANSSQALYQMGPNYNIHGHYNVPPTPVFITSPYPHPVDTDEWHATVGDAYGSSMSYPSRPPGSGPPWSPPPVHTGTVEGELDEGANDGEYDSGWSVLFCYL